MSAHVIVTQEAAADIQEIAAWLSQTGNQKAKLNFLAAVAGASQLLAESPYLGRTSAQAAGLREFIIGRRHRLYYQYEPLGNVLVVLGIVDMRRDPGSIRF